MRVFWLRVKKHWNRTDTLVLGTNHIALAIFIGNCWWRSPVVCYAAIAGPLLLQLYQARNGCQPLGDALWFGAAIGAAWPVGEGLVTSTLGWWGHYAAGGPLIWKTPLYCILIGWLASTHLFYVSRRFMDLGYGRTASVMFVTATAFGMGVLGENLFVASGMWTYRTSAFDLWKVPAFLPVAYGIGYGILPFLRGWRILPATALSAALLFVMCVGLGVAVGFFPA